MKINNFTIVLFSILPQVIFSQSTVFSIDEFDKIIISPHISANLIEADEQTVEVVNSSIDIDKINVKVEGRALRIYLDGAKTITRSKIEPHNRSGRQPIYQGNMVTVNIKYKTLRKLSVRGEQNIFCLSPLDQNEFQLKIYGEPDVHFKNLTLDYFDVTMYDEADLLVESGIIDFQKYISYGDSNVKSRYVKNNSTLIRAYGESDFDINVADHLKVTALGEVQVTYQGAAAVRKGLVLGEVKIRERKESL